MKIHYKGDFEYWWNLKTWWAIEVQPKTGYQVKDAHTMYKKEEILKVIEEKQEELDKLRYEAGNPNFSSEECEEYLSLKKIDEEIKKEKLERSTEVLKSKINELEIELQNREIYIDKLRSRTRLYSSKLKSLRDNHYEIYLKL